MSASRPKTQWRPPRFGRDRSSARPLPGASDSPTAAIHSPGRQHAESAVPAPFGSGLGESLPTDFCVTKALDDKQSVHCEACHSESSIRVPVSRRLVQDSTERAGDLARRDLEAKPSHPVGAASTRQVCLSGAHDSDSFPDAGRKAPPDSRSFPTSNDKQRDALTGQNAVPTTCRVLLSCGAVVLTWLQDPLLTLLASSVTALAFPSVVQENGVRPSETLSPTREVVPSDGGIRNVAVAAVGASGQLCDGVAALTIGLGTTTAVLCSSASKKKTSSSSAVLRREEDRPQRLLGVGEEEVTRGTSSSSCPPSCSLSSPRVRSPKRINVKTGEQQGQEGQGHVPSGDLERGIAWSEVTRSMKERHERELRSSTRLLKGQDREAEEPAAEKLHVANTLQEEQALDTLLALRTCFVGLWISGKDYDAAFS